MISDFGYCVSLMGRFGGGGDAELAEQACCVVVEACISHETVADAEHGGNKQVAMITVSVPT